MEYRGQNILKIHADYLRDFWKFHGQRHDVSGLSKERVISDLQFLGTIKIVYLNPNNTLQKRRLKFDDIKNVRTRYKLRPNQLCLACGNPAKVRHHLIWLKNGGRNNKRNICYLCHDCHAEVHPWLKKQ